MENNKEKMLELLADQTAFGLTEDEALELKMLLKEFPEWENDESFELTALAISMSNLDISEPMPTHLRSKILADSEKYFAKEEKKAETEDLQPTFAFAPRRSIFDWLGWAFAAAFLVVLGVNIWTTRINEQVKVDNPPKTVTPTPELTVTQKREQLLASVGKIQLNWTPPKPDAPAVTGDVVWDNQKQEGYIRFQNLPVIDASKETYQLWIVDETHNPKTPVDGGVFKVNKEGEVIVEIDAKLKIGKPIMFAVTKEDNPEGVVLSDLKGLMAVAKV